MNKKYKEKVKKVAYVAGGIVAVAGRCKKAFDKAWQANLQSVKQLLFHGEICNPYQVGSKFYTGHSKYAWCRSLNPFK